MKKVAPGIVFITLFAVFSSFYLYAQENEGSPPLPSSEDQRSLLLPENTDTSDFIEETEVRPLEGTGGILPLEGALPPSAVPLQDVPLQAEDHPVLVPAEGTLLKGTEGTRPSVPQKGYVGMDACRKCHETDYQSWIVTPHAQWKRSFSPEEKKKGPPTYRIDCESCHGPGSFHVRNPEDKTTIFRFGENAPSMASEQNNACLRCHNRSSTFFWKASVHEPSVPCVECHRLMNRISERNLLTRPTEDAVCYSCHLPIKAKMIHSPHRSENNRAESCRQCHNPHGTATEKLLVAPSINENCYRCHAEKRGPFLFEHFPVTENCVLCHDPHGSSHKNLLKIRQPYLCLDCHTNLPGSHDPFNPESRFTYNRACINCHSQIHGSSHPSGARLQR